MLELTRIKNVTTVTIPEHVRRVIGHHIAICGPFPGIISERVVSEAGIDKGLGRSAKEIIYKVSLSWGDGTPMGTYKIKHTQVFYTGDYKNPIEEKYEILEDDEE